MQWQGQVLASVLSIIYKKEHCRHCKPARCLMVSQQSDCDLSPARPLHLAGDMTGDQDLLLQEAGRRHSSVVLDVGGEKFSARRCLLARFPTTRLGRLVRATRLETVLDLCDEVTLSPRQPPEFFFDKAGSREG